MSKQPAELRSDDEVGRLMDIFSKMPTPSNAEAARVEPKNSKWKHKSYSGVKNNGRVNRTKGK